MLSSFVGKDVQTYVFGSGGALKNMFRIIKKNGSTF
jgi:hypothetical protein